MEEEEFFKQYELEMEMLPQGIEDLGVKIALPKNANKICWEFMIFNKLKIDEIIKISNEFSFVSENDVKFILTRKNKTTEDEK